MFALPYLINFFRKDVRSARLLELLNKLERSASVSISLAGFSLSENCWLANYQESHRDLLYKHNNVDVYKVCPFAQVDSNNFNWLSKFKNNDCSRGKIRFLLRAVTMNADVNFKPESSLSLGGMPVEVSAWVESQRCLTLLAETTHEDLSVIMSNFINDSGLSIQEKYNVQQICSVSYRHEVRETNTRPPNILVFTGHDESSAQERFRIIKETLTGCLDKDKYVIYQLKDTQITTQPWMENAVLLILAAKSQNETSHDNTIFYKFVENGGKLLSVGKEFQLGVTTSGYSKEGLDKTNIIIDESFASSCGSSSIQCVTDAVFEVMTDAEVITDILASTKAGPVVINAVHGRGRAVMSLVDLFVQNTKEEMDDATLVLLKDLLTYLGLQCNYNILQYNDEKKSLLTRAYLLAEDKVKRAFLNKIKPFLIDGHYKSKDMTVYIGEDDHQTTPSFLPIKTSSVPNDVTFSFSTYKDHLRTRILGQIIIYTDVVTSTQTLLNGCLNLLKKLPRNFQPLMLGRQQTIGKGRGGNDWLSPKGCLSFSTPVQIEQDSNLGCRLPFLQHIAALAVVEAVRSRENYQDIDMRIKWPNDIYCGDNVKIGGILVNSTFQERTFHTVVGIGVNLDNSEPTTCINDLARQQDLETFSSEQLLAGILNCMEELLDDFQENGPAGFLTKYHKRWLHSDAKVKVEMLNNEVLTVKGLDDAGFLSVVNATNEAFSLQPDSNSFDMMRNLIAMKRH